MFKEPDSNPPPTASKSSHGLNSSSSSNANKSSTSLNNSGCSNFSVAAASTITTTHNLDDINRLLYVEMRIRAKEDELNVKRQVELAYKKYCENFLQYIEIYSKYVNLIKMAALREVLQRDEQNVELMQHQLQLDEAKNSLENIRVKLSCDETLAFIDEKVLKQFHELLSNMTSYENIEKRCLIMEELKNKYEQIQSSVATINDELGKSTIRGIDYFVERFNDDNSSNMAE